MLTEVKTKMDDEAINIIISTKDAYHIAGGAYGDVYRIEMLFNNIKKIVAVKRNYKTGRGNFIGSIQEIDFMSRLNHENIVNILSIRLDKEVFTGMTGMTDMTDTDTSKPDSISIIMPLGIRDGARMMTDRRIKWKSKKKMMLDLLFGLEYMHSLDIIHRDIKINNFIQIKTKNGMVTKWCDFGGALNHTIQEKKDPVGCVTYIYRAPEIAFGLTNYTTKSDIWSFACVIMSILLGNELTFVTLDKKDVSNNILARHIFSRFPKKIKKKTLNYLDPKAKYRKYIKSNKNSNIGEMLDFDSTEFNKSPGSYKQLLDLLSYILVLDPRERYTATQAINHPFFDKIKKTKTKKIISPEYKLTVLNDLRKQKLRYKAAILIHQYISSMKKKYHPTRIMFHSLRIYTELLNSNIKIETRLGIRLCLYLATKLFVNPSDLSSFQKMFGVVSFLNYKLLKNIEYQFIQYLNGVLYKPTLYETADIILTEKESLALYQYEVDRTKTLTLNMAYQNFKTK